MEFTIQSTSYGTYLILENGFPIVVLHNEENAKLVKEILKKDKEGKTYHE